MDDNLLEEYLDRPVRIHFSPDKVGPGLASYVDGKLYDYSVNGILIEERDGSLDYIPFSAVRLVQIKPKASLWERLTGSG
ncbi:MULTISPECIES: hypothetical protein [Brevibacillus]|jgi:hypothetical protein|uniref:hypothetical protein n=1 Tax=Brevibacillus TaxID=55080 RepID=UPI000EBCAC13|nr:MULTISPECIES: hypothetical protein [Brevibacillus]TGV11913.1 hypothetical protein EN829_050675 [Mesorhizobium sp. M00.F.Ca.ET.186.01.1.1]MBU8711490.1 hypothetical protein [Brevibacillus parabrevis]MDH6349881.1 hypothetical protein [Brevibacillus sp. 1238]MED1721798.1 hypothetical protein [Brevibacillus parabrevis]MED2254104.1 hypothetical protein [Brevibacillus parabrevis]